ncbi:MAG: hypothetical protein F6K48_03125 [Okeania sp. SIO3H1]|nr:hypothetical protein [Okeania sp. SIO3H1]
MKIQRPLPKSSALYPNTENILKKGNIPMSSLSRSDKKEIEKLRARLNDIYSGAAGEVWDEEDRWPSAEELSRIIPAIKAIFEDLVPSHTWSLNTIDKYDTPSQAAEFLFKRGATA